MFITFEGVEGCGKSTIAKLIYNKLKENNFQVMLTREPGGVKIAEDIRKIILNKENVTLDDRSEALLFAASRRQHLVEKVWPALKRGEIVLCDRYIDSSLAYQGGGKHLGVEEILKVNLFATENTFPDLTLLFDIDPKLGLERISSNKDREINRLDLESLSFYNTVRNTFLDLAKKYPERYYIIDASKSIDEVFNETYLVITNKLKNGNI